MRVAIKLGNRAWLDGKILHGTLEVVANLVGNVRSEHYFSEDFAITKRTAISETHSLLLKVDIPNAFNRHIFGTLDGDVGFDNTFFGVPKGPRATINAVRQIQITLRYQF